MKTLFYILIIPLVIFSCNSGKDKSTTTETFRDTAIGTRDSTYSKKDYSNDEFDTLAIDRRKEKDYANSEADTLIIDRRSAVFYQATDAQIAKRKREIGEDTFYIGADDYLFSMHESYDFLETKKLPLIDAGDKRYVKFICSDKSVTMVFLDTLPDLWGFYLFDPRKKPLFADIAMMEEEYAKYYK